MKKKLSAFLAAGMVAFSSSAFGVALTDSIAAAQPSANLIDENAQVNLTIQKYLGDPVSPGTTGAPADTTGLEPLQGISFRVERVNVDLTTQAGWESLANITAENAPLDPNFTAVTKQTGTDGQAVFTNTDGLSVGVYRVTELQAGDYTVAPPFLVTLPYSGENGEWVYQRTVYPKNQSVAPDKQVDDTGATIGTNLAYTINAPVPAGDLTRFNIIDPLDPAVLTLLTDPAIEISAEGVDLAAGDYTVDTANNTLTVTFNESGLAKLETARAANPSLEVSVGFSAQIVSIPEGGAINNTATVQIPGGEVDTDTTPADGTDPVPTNTVFGNLTINKTSTEAGNLAGATFELYECTQNGDNWEVSGGALQMATTTGTPSTTIETVDSNPADTAAVANGYAIPIQSTAGGDTGTVQNTYCVLETQAPDGYVRNPEPQPVAVNLEARTLTANVQNSKDSIIGQLPATGAWGIVLIFLIGLALLARGLYTSYRDNKAEA